MICVKPVGKLVENRPVIHRRIVKFLDLKLSTIYSQVTQWLSTGCTDNSLKNKWFILSFLLFAVGDDHALALLFGFGNVRICQLG